MPQKCVTYKKQARKMIFSVYNFIKTDAETNKIKLTAKELEQMTADATKAPISAVRTIIEEEHQAQDSSYSADKSITPGRKRPRPRIPSNFSLIEQGQIKRIIHNFHVTENEILTMEKLTRKLASELNYEGSENGLRGIIKALGFRWKKVKGDKRLLIEKSDIRYQRIEYLRKLRNYRQAGRNIIYTHHTFIKPGGPFKKRRKSIVETYFGVFCASTDITIIPNTILVYCTSKAEYDEHFYQQYEEWIVKHLICNIPDSSVVIISCEKYHNKHYEVTPMSCAPRTEMIAWLDEKRIKYEQDWLKPQLYSLIKTYKTQNKIFLIDKLLNERNHFVLKLPICHTDLNPLEITWDDIKSYIIVKNIGKFTEFNLKNAFIEKIRATETEFKKLCRNIKDVEQSYRKSDYVIDMLTEEFTFYGGESSDDDDDDDDEAEYDDSVEVKVKIQRLE